MGPVTDKQYGIGELVGEDFCNYDEIKKAADYCDANQFYWDGVISERVNP